jgi:hypothetical protein
MTQVYEVCTCGHLKSQHNDRTIDYGPVTQVVGSNSGSCILCGCERFTHASTVEI